MDQDTEQNPEAALEVATTQSEKITTTLHAESSETMPPTVHEKPCEITNDTISTDLLVKEIRVEGVVEEGTAEEGAAEAVKADEAMADIAAAPCASKFGDGLEPEQQAALIEALIFASGEALPIARLSQVTGIEEATIQTYLSKITEKYAQTEYGFELVCVAGQYQFRTKALFALAVRQLKGTAPRRLSAAALETLAIVAYRQPIVRSDMERIRGVDVTPTLKTLLDRNLVKIVGHQSTVGQPALYGTTDEFLKLFGLSALTELPTLKDLKELEREPGETEQPAEEAPPEQAAAS